MSGSLNDAQKNVPKLNAAVARADRSGFATLVTGTPSIQADFSSTAGTDLRTGESIGAPIALLVLLVVFGAAVAAALPLSLAIVAITLAVALSVLVGQAYNLSVFAINIISMMGLAVGIDYSLFVVSRFREERRKGLREDRSHRRGRRHRHAGGLLQRHDRGLRAARRADRADLDLPQPGGRRDRRRPHGGAGGADAAAGRARACSAIA